MELKVTSVDVSKHFGQFADKALADPIHITKHGRDHLVLMSADEYARLKRRDRHAYLSSELPDEWVDALRTATMDERHNLLNAGLE